jgi:hypothetical protein
MSFGFSELGGCTSILLPVLLNIEGVSIEVLKTVFYIIYGYCRVHPSDSKLVRPVSRAVSGTGISTHPCRWMGVDREEVRECDICHGTSKLTQDRASASRFT